MEKPLSSPSFLFRGELFYNRLTSAPNSYAIVNGGSGTEALKDETLGLAGNFIAMLNPKAGASFYFLAGGGLYRSKLGWNPDNSSSEVVRTAGGIGLGVQTGMGLRVRVGQPELLLEWRYSQALNNTHGAAFMPLTIGISF